MQKNLHECRIPQRMLGRLSQEAYLRGWGAYWCITSGDTPEDGTVIGVPAKVGGDARGCWGTSGGTSPQGFMG